jgi:hypothetical protein
VGLTVILWAVYSHGWGLDVTFFTIEEQVFAGKVCELLKIDQEILLTNLIVVCHHPNYLEYRRDHGARVDATILYATWVCIAAQAAHHLFKNEAQI